MASIGQRARLIPRLQPLLGNDLLHRAGFPKPRREQAFNRTHQGMLLLYTSWKPELRLIFPQHQGGRTFPDPVPRNITHILLHGHRGTYDPLSCNETRSRQESLRHRLSYCPRVFTEPRHLDSLPEDTAGRQYARARPLRSHSQLPYIHCIESYAQRYHPFARVIRR